MGLFCFVLFVVAGYYFVLSELLSVSYFDLFGVAVLPGLLNWVILWDYW